MELDLNEENVQNENKDVNIIEEDKELIKETLQNTDIKVNENEKIEAPKEEKQKKKEKIKDLVKDQDLSDEELEQCVSLQSDLDLFMKEKAKLEIDTGVIDVLPTGIDLLDAVLGGGFGVGTMSMIIGNPGTFKSSLLGQIIGSSQKKYKGKLLASYLDSEAAMTTKRLIELGVKTPPIKPYSDICIEDVFKTINCHCSFKELKEIKNIPSIISWDSVANTPSLKEKESENDDINSFIGLKARILSILIPKYISKLRNYNISLIVINQLREKIDMGFFTKANDLRWMGEKSIPGGQALKFNAFHLLLLVVKGDLKVEQYGFNGVKLEAKCVKNKLFTPNIPITLMVDFNTGINNFWTNYQFLIDNKKLKSGAWNYLVAKPEIKFRTKDAKKMYNENDDFRKVFDEEVKNTIDIEIKQKYNSYI